MHAIPEELSSHMQVTFSYYVHRHPLDLELIWKLKMVRQRSMLNSSRDLDVENISVKLQHNACNSSGSIAFTRLVWKIKMSHKDHCQLLQDFDVENIPVKLQHGVSNSWSYCIYKVITDFGIDWKFKKVKQRLTSHLVDHFMRITLLHIQLQHNTDKFYGVTLINYHPLSFDNDLICKVTIQH